MVTWPAAAKAADGNPTNASNSQQAPASQPATSTHATNLQPRTIIPSTATDYAIGASLLPSSRDICKRGKNFWPACARTSSYAAVRLDSKSRSCKWAPRDWPTQDLPAPFVRRGFPSAPRRSRPPAPRRGWRVPAWPGRFDEPQADCHISPFAPAGTFPNKPLLPHFPVFNLAEPDLCHGASRHDSLFPSRKAILTFSNVRVARRNQLH